MGCLYCLRVKTTGDGNANCQVRSLLRLAVSNGGQIIGPLVLNIIYNTLDVRNF